MSEPYPTTITLDVEEYEEMIEQYKDMEKENGRLIDDNNKMDDEIERLKEEYQSQVEILLDDKKQLNWEIERLKQALSRCSPFVCRDIAWKGKQEDGFKIFERVENCCFCGQEEHKSDCEYLKLCGGGK